MSDNSTIVSIGFDYRSSMNKALSEMESKLTGFEKKYSGQKIEYKITGNKTQLDTILKQISGLKPESLVLNFDDSDFRKRLKNLSDIVQNNGNDMAVKFSNSIKNNIANMDFQNIIEREFGKGTKAGAGKLKEMAQRIEGYINNINIKDAIKENDVSTIEKAVSYYREMASISKYLKQNFSDSSVKLSKAFDIENISKNFSQVFSSDNLNAAISKMTSDFKNEFELIRNFVLQTQNILSGKFDTNVTDKYIAAIKENILSVERQINSFDLDKAKENLIETFKTASNESKRTKSDINSFIDAFERFKTLGGKTKELETPAYIRHSPSFLYESLTGKDSNIKVKINAKEAQQKLNELLMQKENLERNLTTAINIKNTNGVNQETNKEIQTINAKIESIQNSEKVMNNAAESEISNVQHIIDKINELKQIITVVNNEKLAVNSVTDTGKITQDKNTVSDTSKLLSEKAEIGNLTESVNTLKNAFHSKTESIIQEENQMRQSASKEIQSLINIKNAVNEVNNAIKNMSKSMAVSEQNIRRSVGKEVNTFNSIVEKAKALSKELNYISNIKIPDIKISTIKSDDTSKIKSSVTKELNTVVNAANKSANIESLAKAIENIAAALMIVNDCINIPDIFNSFNKSKNAGTNLNSIASALDNIKISLNGLSGDGSSFLKGIADITKETESLKNLSVILKESREKIKEVKAGTNQNKDTINPQTKALDMLNNFQSKFSLSNITAEFEVLKRSISEISNENGLNKFISQLKSLEERADSFSNIENIIHKTSERLNKFKFADGTELAKELLAFKPKINLLSQDLKNGVINIENYNKEVSNLFNTFERRVKLGNVELVNMKDVTNFNEAKRAALDYAGSLGNVKKVLSHNEYPNGNDFYKMTVRIQETTGAIKNLTFVYDDCEKKMSASSKYMKNETSNFGKAVDGLKSKIFQLSTYWTAMLFNPYSIFHKLRQGFNISRELDDAFTEMRKVSELSVESLKRYQAESFNLAGNIGTTSKQLQESTADFMRLGESFEEAKKSAQSANILLNVSEFENIDDATKSLISISQAYKELDKTEINDILNNIGNKFSISTDGLASALQRSASALTTAGNDINEASALITAGNAVPQDPDSVGAGIRTIALRIQGTKEAKNELASLGENVDDFVVQTSSKIDSTVRNFTAVASNGFKGISVLDDNGNYRSTYEILQDIADIYYEIQETDKKAGTNRLQGLLETIAGKNRSNIAASILQNGEMLRDVYEEAQNSEGSAQEELEKHLDSLTGKITQLQNQMQELSNITFDSEFFKVLIQGTTDTLSLITSLIDKVGVFSLLGAGLGTFLSFKNIGKTNYSCL